MARKIGLLLGGLVVLAAAGTAWLRRTFNRPPDPAAFKVLVDPLPAQDATGAHVTITPGTLGVQLYTRWWRAPAPKAFVVFVHGLTFHSGYLGPTAKRLQANAYTVVAFDLPGHGLSGSTHGVRGYHPGLEAYLDEVEAVVAQAAAAAGQLPLFLVGESLGGALLVAALSSRPALAARVVGAVTMGAPTGLPPILPPAPVVAVVMAVGRVLPLIPMPPDKTTERDSWIGAFGDQALAATAYDTDPLILKTMPSGAAPVLLPLLNSLPTRLASLTTPVLALHGEDDDRVSPEHGRRLVDSAASDDKTLRLLPGMRHQLLQESEANQEVVWGILLDWLDARVGTP